MISDGAAINSKNKGIYKSVGHGYHQAIVRRRIFVVQDKCKFSTYPSQAFFLNCCPPHDQIELSEVSVIRTCNSEAEYPNTCHD